MSTALKQMTIDEFLPWAEARKGVGNCMTAFR